MSTNELNNAQAHEGRPVGIKLLVEFSPDETERLTQLADEAGVSLTDYIRRLVNDVATARAR